jgi:hypothetical protein
VEWLDRLNDSFFSRLRLTYRFDMLESAWTF